MWWRTIISRWQLHVWGFYVSRLIYKQTLRSVSTCFCTKGQSFFKKNHLFLVYNNELQQWERRESWRWTILHNQRRVIREDYYSCVDDYSNASRLLFLLTVLENSPKPKQIFKYSCFVLGGYCVLLSSLKMRLLRFGAEIFCYFILSHACDFSESIAQGDISIPV